MEQLRRNRLCTQVQREHLVCFMREHPELALNSFRGNMGQHRNQQLWAQLQKELEELGPPKTIEQWRITWRDLKTRAKSANATLYRAQRQTGNTWTVPILSNMEENIISVLGRTSSEGLPNIPETGLGESAADENTAEVLSPTVEDVQPGPSSASTARPSTREKSLGRIYEKSSNRIVTVLTEISNHLKDRNEIEKERNTILKKKNEILERYLNQNIGLLPVSPVIGIPRRETTGISQNSHVNPPEVTFFEDD